MSKKKLKHDAATTKSGTPDTVSASSVGKHKSKNKMSTNAVSTSLKIRKSQAMTTGNVNEVYSSNTTTTTILSVNISSLSSKSGDTRPLDFLKSLFGKNIDPNILVVSCAGFLILTIVLCCIVVVYYRRRLKKVAKDKVRYADLYLLTTFFGIVYIVSQISFIFSRLASILCNDKGMHCGSFF